MTGQGMRAEEAGGSTLRCEKAGWRRKKAQRTWRAAREKSWAQAGHSEAQAEVKGRGTCQGRAQWAGGGGGGKKLAGRRQEKASASWRAH